MRPDLTIVLPAYNEEEAIGLVIEEIRSLPWLCEVLIGDNNSTDSTYRICCSMGVTPVPVAIKGKGNVIRELIKKIETPYAIMVNADYTYPLMYANLIYELLKVSKYDVIIGCRSLKDKGAMSLINSTGNCLLSILASLLYQHRISDLCSGMWGFKTDKLRTFNLSARGFTLEADLFSNSVKNKCNISQIPIGYRARIGDSRPKLKVRDGFKIAWSLLEGRLK